MENPKPKFSQSSIISKKPGYFSEIIKTLMRFKYNIFCWNFAYVSYLTMSTNGCSRLFFDLLDFDLLIKMYKMSV